MAAVTGSRRIEYDHAEYDHTGQNVQNVSVIRSNKSKFGLYSQAENALDQAAVIALAVDAGLVLPCRRTSTSSRSRSGLCRTIARRPTLRSPARDISASSRDTLSRRVPIRAARTCCGGGGLSTLSPPPRSRDSRSSSAMTRLRTV